MRPASPHSYEESTSPSYDDAEHCHPTSSAASSVLIAPLEVLLDPFEDPLVFRRWPVPVGTNGGTSVFPLPTTAGIIKRQHAHLDARLAYYKKTDEESNGWQTIPQPQSPSKIWPKVPPFPPPPRRSALPLVEGEQEPQSIPLKSTNRPTSGCESSRPSSSGRRSLLERTLASDPVAAETTPADDVATPAMESLRQALVAQLQRVMDLFRKLDANGDGKVSVQEFQAPPRPACKGSPRRLVPSPQVSAQEFQAVLGLIAPRTTADQPVPAAPAAPDDGAQQGTVAALGGDVGVASEGGEGAPAAFGAADVEALFHLLDRDSSGTIDYRELNTMLRQGLRVSLDAKLRVGAAGEIALEAKNRFALRSLPPTSPEPSPRVTTLDKARIDEAFWLIDANEGANPTRHSGLLSRAEVLKALRAQPRVRELLGLPEVICKEDGTRVRFEAVYQRIARRVERHRDKKAIDRSEFFRALVSRHDED